MHYYGIGIEPVQACYSHTHGYWHCTELELVSIWKRCINRAPTTRITTSTSPHTRTVPDAHGHPAACKTTSSHMYTTPACPVPASPYAQRTSFSDVVRDDRHAEEISGRHAWSCQSHTLRTRHAMQRCPTQPASAHTTADWHRHTTP